MKTISCWKDGLTRIVLALVIGAMLNMSGLYLGSAFAANHDTGTHSSLSNDRETLDVKSQMPVSYGVDPDKVLFALKADGTKARYLSLSPANFKVEFTKESKLGEVEFHRLSNGETLTTFTPVSGDPLLIRTIVSSPVADKKAPDFNLVFQLSSRKVALEVNQNQPPAPLAQSVEQQVQDIFAAAKVNPSLVNLTREVTFFLSKPVIARVLRRAIQVEDCIRIDPLDCAREALTCVGTIIVYLYAIGGLITVCPETIGGGCIAALLAHPFLGAIVAAQCASAVNSCGFGSGNKRPCPKNVGQDFEIIMQ